jgi:hypothetical protein
MLAGAPYRRLIEALRWADMVVRIGRPDGPGEGGGEHASERTSRCVSEHAQPTTHASAFHGAAVIGASRPERREPADSPRHPDLEDDAEPSDGPSPEAHLKVHHGSPVGCGRRHPAHPGHPPGSILTSLRIRDRGRITSSSKLERAHPRTSREGSTLARARYGARSPADKTPGNIAAANEYGEGPAHARTVRADQTAGRDWTTSRLTPAKATDSPPLQGSAGSR